MRRWLLTLLILLVSAGGMLLLQDPSSAEIENDMLIGMNMPGSDIASFDLNEPDPGLCRQACDARSDCRAWTFVIAGVQGPAARCWLKNSVPASVRDGNTISASMPASDPRPIGASVVPEMQVGTNLPGADLMAGISLPSSDPALCQRACDARGDCRAWTFVKPGVQGPNAVCWVKNAVP